MTRQMYDSLNPEAIPEDAEMVASYIDGDNAPADGWESRFAHAVIVRIARIPTTDAGDVLDAGDNGVTALQAVEWVKLRRAAGADPAVYTNAASWPSLRAAFVAAGIGEPHYWVAQWDNQTAIPAGAVAKQYADSRMTGADYDCSIVDDEWLAAAPAPAPAPAPVPAAGTYTVHAGDTMWAIAQRHGLTLAELESANPAAGHPAGDFSMLWPGDVLNVTGPVLAPAPAPHGNAYVVQEGDTMWAIAQRHGVTLAELESANPSAGHPAGDFSMIYAGDVLLIP